MKTKSCLPLLVCGLLLGCASPSQSKLIETTKASYGTRGADEVSPVDAATWRDMVERGRSEPLTTKILRTRVYFDALARVKNSDLWGDNQYWGSLPEILDVGAAAPRDLTVAYYVTLRAMGVAAGDMRILLGTVPRVATDDTAERVPYSILIVRSAGRILYVDPFNRTEIATAPPNGFANGLAVNEDGEWLLLDRSLSYAWGASAKLGTYMPAWVHAWDESKRLIQSPDR